MRVLQSFFSARICWYVACMQLYACGGRHGIYFLHFSAFSLSRMINSFAYIRKSLLDFWVLFGSRSDCLHCNALRYGSSGVPQTGLFSSGRLHPASLPFSSQRVPSAVAVVGPSPQRPSAHSPVREASPTGRRGATFASAGAAPGRVHSLPRRTVRAVVSRSAVAPVSPALRRRACAQRSFRSSLACSALLTQRLLLHSSRRARRGRRGVVARGENFAAVAFSPLPTAGRRPDTTAPLGQEMSGGSRWRRWRWNDAGAPTRRNGAAAGRSAGLLLLLLNQRPTTTTPWFCAQSRPPLSQQPILPFPFAGGRAERRVAGLPGWALAWRKAVGTRPSPLEMGPFSTAGEGHHRHSRQWCSALSGPPPPWFCCARRAPLPRAISNSSRRLPHSPFLLPVRIHCGQWWREALADDDALAFPFPAFPLCFHPPQVHV